MVCFAIGAVCDTSGCTKLRLYPAPLSEAKDIPDGKIYCGGSVDTESIVTAIKVTAHTYTQGGTGDDVIDVGGTKYVHTTTITTINNPNVTATDKQNIVEITDATLINTSNVDTVAQRVFDYYTRRNTLNARIVVSDEKPGDYVSIKTPWGAEVCGNIEVMNIVLSNTTAADIKVKAVTT